MSEVAKGRRIVYRLIAFVIYRRDALQTDGKPGGNRVVSSSREKFTVRLSPRLTVISCAPRRYAAPAGRGQQRESKR
jgi:hypothetical protein